MPINDFICPICDHVEKDVPYPSEIDEFMKCTVCKEPTLMQVDYTAYKTGLQFKGLGWTPKFGKKNMSWNYRVVKKGTTYRICEVYYDCCDRPEYMSADSTEPFGVTRQELRKDIEAMLKAFDQRTFKEPKGWVK